MDNECTLTNIIHYSFYVKQYPFYITPCSLTGHGSQQIGLGDDVNLLAFVADE